MREITVSDDLVEKAAIRKTYAEGWHFGPVVGNNNKTNDKGNFLIVNRLAAMADPSDPRSLVSSPTIQHYMVLPFPNDEVEGHEPPDVSSMVVGHMRGYFGIEEIPFDPIKDNKTQKWMFEGSEIAPEQVEASKKSVARKGLVKAAEGFNDGKMFVRPDEGLFFLVKHSNGFASVAKVSQSLPKGETLVPGDSIVVDAPAPQ